MIAGPWGSYSELVRLADSNKAPRAFNGSRPVAIERKRGDVARLLYEYPKDREPVPGELWFDHRPGVPVHVSFPEYIYIDA